MKPHETSLEKFEPTLRKYIQKTHPNSGLVPEPPLKLAKGERLIVPQLQWTFDVTWQIDRVNKYVPKNERIELPKLGEQYVMICAHQIYDENSQLEVFEFPANSVLLAAVERLRCMGARVITGRWVMMPGQPLAVIMQLHSIAWAFERYKSELFRDHGILVPEDDQSREVLLYGYIAAQFLAEFRHLLDSSQVELYRQSKIMANFHEWLTTVGLIFLQDWKIPAATIYRPHDPIKNDPSTFKDPKSTKLPNVVSGELQPTRTLMTNQRKGGKTPQPEQQLSKVNKPESGINSIQPEEKSERVSGIKSVKEFQPKNLVKNKAANFEKGEIASKPVEKTVVVVPRVERVKATASRFESGDESDARPIEKTVIHVPRLEKVKTTAARFESGDESDVKPTRSVKSIRKSSAAKPSKPESLSGKPSDNGTNKNGDPAVPYAKVLPPSDPEVKFKDWKPRNAVKEAAMNIENAKLAYESDCGHPGTNSAARIKKETEVKKSFNIHDEDWPDLDSESVT